MKNPFGLTKIEWKSTPLDRKIELFLILGGMIIAGIVMIITGYQVGQMRVQTNAMKQQLDVMKNQLVSTQRAYVGITGLDVTKIQDTKRMNTWWKVAPIIVNSGNTPTRNLWWTIVTNHYDPEYEKHGHLIPSFDFVKTATKNFATLSPKQETRTLIYQAVPEEWVGPIREQRGRLYVYGALIYEDFLTDESHVTRYCYALWGFPPITGDEFSYSMCGGKSNCADKECEPESTEHEASNRQSATNSH
jgi:hypothetical protein